MGFTFCQFSEVHVDIFKSGNVVPNSFHFYARWNEYGSGKSSAMLSHLWQETTTFFTPHFFVTLGDKGRVIGLGIDQFFQNDICINTKWKIFNMSFDIQYIIWYFL